MSNGVELFIRQNISIIILIVINYYVGFEYAVLIALGLINGKQD